MKESKYYVLSSEQSLQHMRVLSMLHSVLIKGIRFGAAPAGTPEYVKACSDLTEERFEAYYRLVEDTYGNPNNVFTPKQLLSIISRVADLGICKGVDILYANETTRREII